MLPNLFMLPYMKIVQPEKLASEGGTGPTIEALLSGDPEKLAAIFSDEDLAFLSLSESTVEKLASGEGLTTSDLTDTEIAALTILGDTAHLKVAAYGEFLDSVMSYELSARRLAQNVYEGVMKTAMEDDGAEAEAEEETSSEEEETPPEKEASMKVSQLLQDEEARRQLLKMAQDELNRRQRRLSA
jgi:hypothetical protein